jgi:hypothetical protein
MRATRTPRPSSRASGAARRPRARSSSTAGWWISLPFEIDRFSFEGTAAVTAIRGELTVTGKPHNERRSHPLITSVSNYSR